ncbi:hypothetical protein D9M72_431450 [compost metagenome]
MWCQVQARRQALSLTRTATQRASGGRAMSKPRRRSSSHSAFQACSSAASSRYRPRQSSSCTGASRCRSTTCIGSPCGSQWKPVRSAAWRATVACQADFNRSGSRPTICTSVCTTLISVPGAMLLSNSMPCWPGASGWMFSICVAASGSAATSASSAPACSAASGKSLGVTPCASARPLVQCAIRASSSCLKRSTHPCTLAASWRARLYITRSASSPA